MARTVDHAARAVRRDAFIEAAQRLIVTKGYDALSVQDLLDAVGASKGAFYHYFDSKQALLSAVIDDMTDTVVGLAQPVVENEDLAAPAKLRELFRSIAQWKYDQSDLMFEIIETWWSDGNILVREHLRATVLERLSPVIAQILEQGVAEGSVEAFDGAVDTRHAAQVFLALLLATQEVLGRVLIDHRAGRVDLDEVERTMAAYVAAGERVLGVPAGTMAVIDRPTLEFWFEGPSESERESAA
jgi:AcrR family transcriptional regulator